VGEIGLDFFVPGLDAERQTRFYRQQLQLARRFDLPVILHVRRSADALLKGLRELPVQGGIAHAFNGSLQQARAFIALGFKLGFGGALSYERALQLRRLATELPIEALVLETDAPDMPPHWLYRTAAERAAGLPQGRNAPAELPRIAQVLADLRGMPLEALAQQTRPMPCRHCRACGGVSDNGPKWPFALVGQAQAAIDLIVNVTKAPAACCPP
jgi:TatD DNase family protein